MKYKWTVLTVTTIGVLMSGIDSRIVMVGLPQVASSLGADAEQAIWFTQAYVLGSTVALLLIGRITDIFGRVKIYTSGFAIFTIGSALTSLGMSPIQVIVFRVIQGLGSGIILTNSMVMITDATPEKELGFSLGINQIAFRFGAVGGLTLSGVILSLLDWRALFYVNIPIGIFGTLWAHRRLRELGQLERGGSIDWIGFSTFTLSVASFLLSLTFAAYGSGGQFATYLLVVLGAASLVVFVLYERKIEHPILDLKLLGIREFTGGVVAQLLNAISWGAVLLLLSLYFQIVLNLSPLEAGLRMIPLEVGVVLFGPLSGKLSDRFGHLPFTTSGLVMSSSALLLLSTTDTSTPYYHIAVYILLLGAGIGVFTAPNVSSIMSSVPPARRGIASAFRIVLFNVGFTISLNLAILIMTFTVPYELVTSLVSSVNPLSVPEVERELFSEGLKQTYLSLAVLNTVAIAPSLLRGKRIRNDELKTSTEEK